MNDPKHTVDWQNEESEEMPSSKPLTPRLPEKIGRYQIEQLLGKGGFGLVYLAYDNQLQVASSGKQKNYCQNTLGISRTRKKNRGLWGA